MAEIREEGGQFFRRRAGRRDWEEVSPEVAEAERSGRFGRLGSSAAGGLESFGRNFADLSSRLNELIPGYEIDEEWRAGNRARLEELRRRQEAIEEVDPVASWGQVAPELAGGLLGRTLRGTMAIEAGIGAVRQPEAPLEGAAIGGGLGAGSWVLGAGVGALGRRLSRGTRRGLEQGEAIVDRSRQETVRERLREGLFGMDAGDVRGTPGSITGLDTREIGQAANRGWGMRMAGWVDGAPDEAFNREAAELGFRLTPGVARNSDALRSMEAALESRPGGAAAFDELRKHNDEILKGHLVRALGGEGTDLSPEAMGQLKGRLENTFEDAGRQIGDVDLKGALREINRLVDEIDDPDVQGWLGSIANKVPADIKGPSLMKKLQYYRRMADNQWTSQSGHRGKAEALDALADIVERHMLRQAPRQVGKALEDAGERWRLLRTVERGKTITSDGELSPVSLDSALRGGYKNEYRYGGTTGNPDIERLSRAARVAYGMRDIVGNSGTATRSQNPIQQLTEGQLLKGFGKAYLEGLDLTSARQMATGATATAAGGAAAGGLLFGD